ncbi:homeobox protein Wariai-like [Pecten maximus]|uniref:homeobox protein Wariai-like n=1 Tax=Pecten maximus TaxID=6579 RepID=UPI0014588C9F|nr:homeobox protein Wariai-like [Pecten maximus]
MNFMKYCCQQQKRKERRRHLQQDNEPMIPTSESPKMTPVLDHVSRSASTSDSINSAYITMISGQCGTPHQDMMFAVLHNDKVTLQRLIEKDEAINSWTDIFQFVNRSQRVVTPMELACMLGYIDLVELFLDNGCSPNLPTTAGRLIHTIMDTLKSEKMDSKEGQSLVKRLCNEGCYVNIFDQNHKTPILLAAELGNVEILRTLLSVVDPVVLNHGDVPNGFTPLHMSAMRGDLDCVLEILKYCTPSMVNITDGKGYTPLKLALVSMYKNVTYMNNLIKVSKNGTNESSQLQHLRQLQYQSVGIIEALLLHGAEINNQTDNYKETLLYQALELVCKDETCEKFRHDKYSHTMQLIASTKLQDLSLAIVGNESEGNKQKTVTASPYSGIVRLFVLYGADPIQSKDIWQQNFGMFGIRDQTEVQQLIDEVFYFWENNIKDGPPKLIHLSKQVIRTALASCQNLHKMDDLPLPPSLIAFIKLQCL